MNADQIKGLIRHGLTAGGGAGFALSSDELQQFLSGLITLLGIIWSIIEKRKSAAPKPPTGTVAAAAALGLVLLGGFGCSAIAPGNEAAVVRAEQTLTASFDVVDSFLQWERSVPDAPSDVRQVANTLRRDFPPSHRAAAALLKEYKVNRTPENKANLDTLLAVLRAAQSQATTLLAHYSTPPTP
jgi:hypothetical protein